MKEENTEQSLEDFLREEVVFINRSNQQTLWLGGIFAVALIVYMFLILRMVQEITDPELITNYIAAQVEEQTPVIIGDIERELKRQAPLVANSMSESFVHSIPELRRLAETQIDFCARDMIPHLSRELQEVIRSYIEDNGEEFREFVNAHKNDENFAKSFTADLARELGEALDNELRNNSEYDFESFKYNILHGLVAINQHLEELSVGRPEELPHRLQLQRKIIAAMINKLTSEELPASSTNIPLLDFWQEFQR